MSGGVGRDGAELIYMVGMLPKECWSWHGALNSMSVLPKLMSGGQCQRAMVQGHLPPAGGGHTTCLHGSGGHVSGFKELACYAGLVDEMA